MSEYQPLEMEPIEDDAEVVIDVGEGMEFRATRHNTLLSTYIGRAAFNNIFIWDEKKSMRMFKEAPHYEQLQDYILENFYPMDLNQTVVPPEIQELYVKTVMRHIPDALPEDW